MSDACFTYGSLMCEEIMARVTGREVHGRPAVLAGHARYPVRGEDYPGMVPEAGANVAGLLYGGLAEAELRCLDRFEGEMYERRKVVVTVSESDPIEAWAYVFKPAFGHLLLAREWSFERFLAEGQARFRARYLGFGALE